MSTSELEKLFVKFQKQCVWLRICYNTYHALYESGARTEKILRDSAPWFFHDLNTILIEYVHIQICKITDPAEIGRRKNLTIESLNAKLLECNLMTKEISDLSDNLLYYRSLIINARNKLHSHLDLETVLNDESIAGHSKEKKDKFFSDLQDYNDAVGNAIGVGPLDFSASPCQGDVFDLIKVLKRGVLGIQA